MKISQADVLSPANGMTLVGFALSVVGALHFNSLSGVLLFGSGRLLDIADGAVARRTHTSDFGALLDATADKVVFLVVIVSTWQHHIVPWPLLLFILVQNAVNAVDYLYASRLGTGTRPSKAGKYAITGQAMVIGAFGLAQFGWYDFWTTFGWVEFMVQLPFALQASAGYTKLALASRHSKANTTTRKP